MKRIIADFMRKNILAYLVGIIFMFSSSYIQTLFPRVLGRTIDILKYQGFDRGAVKLNIIYILLIAVGTFLSTFLWRNFFIGNTRKLECFLREKLFEHFQRLSPEFYNNRKTGDLIAYAVNDISAVRMTFGPAAAMTINGLGLCIAAIYSMASTVNWRLTLMSLLPIPIIVFFMINIGGRVQKRFKRVQESFGAISGRVQENINGIRVIKAYVQEEKEVMGFEKLNNSMMEANINMVRVSSLLSPIIEISFSISFVFNLIIGGRLVLKGEISLGDFIAFNTYLVMIMQPVITIGRIINIIQRGMASIKRLDEIFKVEPRVLGGEVNTPIKGRIEINNLSFSYPGSQDKALNGLDINIEAGKTIGIIGKTGSGKTTLASLLLRLYNVDRGSIKIDGVDINDYSLETLRDGFGFVPQDNFLFSAKISENIRFFKEDSLYGDEGVFSAARNSCIYDSIEELENGFDTLLGERGVNLSGGQKQRIAIARAIIRNSPILILDDSLSAVDSITERKILENLRNIRCGKTAIIIAHRISAIEDADEILVLDEGRIVERGKHQELVGMGGAYYEIYMEQYKRSGEAS